MPQATVCVHARALIDPALGALRDEGFDLLREVGHNLVRRFVDAGAPAPHLDAGMEATRLHALVDGLLVHGVLRPGRADPGAIRRVLEQHLDALAPAVADRYYYSGLS